MNDFLPFSQLSDSGMSREKLVEETERTVLKYLEDSRSPSSLTELMLDLYDFCDSLIAGIVAADQIELACHAGCSHCCGLPVYASPAELIVIYRRLRSEWRPESFSQLRQEVRSLAEATASMTPQEWAAAPHRCPLLKDGLCQVYDVRPLTCRGWNSLDADLCRQVMEDPKDVKLKVVGTIHYTATDIQDGLKRGLARLGMHAEPMELIVGLDFVLREPRSVLAWIEGEGLDARKD